jgi:ribonuclease-3
LHGGGRARPALLCATFESLIGALYLHGDIIAVRDFLFPMLEKAADEILLQPDMYDPKSRLQEWAQGRKLGIPRYETRSAEGPDHAKTFAVDVNVDGRLMGSGTGPNKQVAAQNAAADALSNIENFIVEE